MVGCLILVVLVSSHDDLQSKYLHVPQNVDNSVCDTPSTAACFLPNHKHARNKKSKMTTP